LSREGEREKLIETLLQKRRDGRREKGNNKRERETRLEREKPRTTPSSILRKPPFDPIHSSSDRDREGVLWSARERKAKRREESAWERRERWETGERWEMGEIAGGSWRDSLSRATTRRRILPRAAEERRRERKREVSERRERGRVEKSVGPRNGKVGDEAAETTTTGPLSSMMNEGERREERTLAFFLSFFPLGARYIETEREEKESAKGESGETKRNEMEGRVTSPSLPLSSSSSHRK